MEVSQKHALWGISEIAENEREKVKGRKGERKKDVWRNSVQKLSDLMEEMDMYIHIHAPKELNNIQTGWIQRYPHKVHHNKLSEDKENPERSKRVATCHTQKDPQ